MAARRKSDPVPRTTDWERLVPGADRPDGRPDPRDVSGDELSDRIHDQDLSRQQLEGSEGREDPIKVFTGGGSHKRRQYHANPVDDFRDSFSKTVSSVVSDPRSVFWRGAPGEERAAAQSQWRSEVVGRRLFAMYDSVERFSAQAAKNIAGRRLAAPSEVLTSDDLGTRHGKTTVCVYNKQGVRVPVVQNDAVIAAGEAMPLNRRGKPYVEGVDDGPPKFKHTVQLGKTRNFACPVDDYLSTPFEKLASLDGGEGWRELGARLDPAMARGLTASVKSPKQDPAPHGEPALPLAWPDALEDAEQAAVRYKPPYLSGAERAVVARLADDSIRHHRNRCLRNPAEAESCEVQWAGVRRASTVRAEYGGKFPEDTRRVYEVADDFDRSTFPQWEKLRFAGRVAALTGRKWENPDADSRADQQFIADASQHYPVLASALKKFDPESPLRFEPVGPVQAVKDWRSAVDAAVDGVLYDAARKPAPLFLEKGSNPVADAVHEAVAVWADADKDHRFSDRGSFSLRTRGPAASEPAVRPMESLPPVTVRPLADSARQSPVPGRSLVPDYPGVEKAQEVFKAAADAAAATVPKAPAEKAHAPALAGDQAVQNAARVLGRAFVSVQDGPASYDPVHAGQAAEIFAERLLLRHGGEPGAWVRPDARSPEDPAVWNTARAALSDYGSVYGREVVYKDQARADVRSAVDYVDAARGALDAYDISVPRARDLVEIKESIAGDLPVSDAAGYSFAAAAEYMDDTLHAGIKSAAMYRDMAAEVYAQGARSNQSAPDWIASPATVSDVAERAAEEMFARAASAGSGAPRDGGHAIHAPERTLQYLDDTADLLSAARSRLGGSAGAVTVPERCTPESYREYVDAAAGQVGDFVAEAVRRDQRDRRAAHRQVDLDLDLAAGLAAAAAAPALDRDAPYAGPQAAVVRGGGGPAGGVPAAAPAPAVLVKDSPAGADPAPGDGVPAPGGGSGGGR